MSYQCSLQHIEKEKNGKKTKGAEDNSIRLYLYGLFCPYQGFEIISIVLNRPSAGLLPGVGQFGAQVVDSGLWSEDDDALEVAEVFVDRRPLQPLKQVNLLQKISELEKNKFKNRQTGLRMKGPTDEWTINRLAVLKSLP